MIMFYSLILLILLFITLGWAAGFAVRKIRFVASILKIKLFGLGIILGIITTLPELAIGINAIIEDTPALSIGNILGGIIVLLGLIIGGSLLLNYKIKTVKSLSSLIPSAIVISLPLFLGLDGKFSSLDGLIMIFSYVVLLIYLYFVNYSFNNSQESLINKNGALKAILLSFVSVIVIIIASRWIVEITTNLLRDAKIDGMLVGLLLFPIGTNLPEITIMLASWKAKVAELSLSHIISAAFTHTLILGLLAVMGPMNFIVSASYYFLIFFVIAILLLTIKFCYSNKSLSRKEGYVLLSVYVVFVLTNIILAKFPI